MEAMQVGLMLQNKTKDYVGIKWLEGFTKSQVAWMGSYNAAIIVEMDEFLVQMHACIHNPIASILQTFFLNCGLQYMGQKPKRQRKY